jgi:NTP pyrophosphatase (non-canonical NTP hydrolase)
VSDTCCECGNEDGQYWVCQDCLMKIDEPADLHEAQQGGIMTVGFNHYQNATDCTAIYPEAGTGSLNALTYATLGLGEAGEVQGKVKKILRDDGGAITPAKRQEIAAELGDLLWYVARVAAEIDYPLANIAEANLAKLWDRRNRNVLKGSGDTR